jgi:PTS system mannose-specific IIB component
MKQIFDIISEKISIRKKPKSPLLRIDDRLIHGQVIVGWGNRLGLRKIILANDKASADSMRKNLYLSLMPPEIEGEVLNLKAMAHYIQDIPLDGLTMIVVENLSDALSLIEMGFKVDRITIGGLHHKDGCEKFLSYVFLNDERKKDLKKLLDLKVSIICQDLPTNSKYQIDEKVLTA